jgi:hypothetical protein
LSQSTTESSIAVFSVKKTNRPERAVGLFNYPRVLQHSSPNAGSSASYLIHRIDAILHLCEIENYRKFMVELCWPGQTMSATPGTAIPSAHTEVVRIYGYLPGFVVQIDGGDSSPCIRGSSASWRSTFVSRNMGRVSQKRKVEEVSWSFPDYGPSRHRCRITRRCRRFSILGEPTETRRCRHPSLGQKSPPRW